jgi:GNAT superfamily N-acetyltransferase
VTPIRPLVEETDLAEVVELSVRAWAPVFDSLRTALGAPMFALQFPEGWEAAQRAAVAQVAGGPHVWVAEDGGAVAGFVAVGLDRATRTGEIVMVAVDPVRQRRGIGRALTGFAVEWMREQGMTVGMVDTGGDPGHAPARRTYERAGFRPLPIARYFIAL